MTLYTRDYRPYDKDDKGDKGDRGGAGTAGFRRGGLRFLPMVVEGSRDARRGKAFRSLGMVIVVLTTILGFLLYFQAGPLIRALERSRFGPAGVGPQYYLEAAIVRFHEWSALFVVLLTLFVGAGLVADDLRTRALPLYLARPIRPLDYLLGKLLVPVTVLFVTVFVPTLVLLALAVLMRPTEEMLSFLGGQGRLAGAMAVHFVALSFAYSSLVLLFSAATSRPLTAVVLGSATFLGGEMVRNAAGRLDHPLADAIRALSLTGDTRVVLLGALGRDATEIGHRPYASPTAAWAALAAVVVLGCLAVLGRARSVEVTS